MMPDLFHLPISKLPEAWQRIAFEIATFCGIPEMSSFFALWQMVSRDAPKSLTVATFPPGSAVLERISHRTAEEVLHPLLCLARGSNLESLEGKPVLAVLKEHCPKPAKQKRPTRSERWGDVIALRRRNRKVP